MGLHLAINFERIDPTKGGAETYVADLCRRLVRLGHQVDLYAKTWATDVLPREVRTVRVPVSGRSRLARIWSFAENSAERLAAGTHDCSVGFINTWAHDVLIPQGGVHDGSLECNARRYPDGWRRRAYLWAKTVNPKHGVYRRIEARQYDPEHGAKIIVAAGRMVEEHLKRFHHVDPGRIRRIPNAIDADRLIVPNPESARSSFRRDWKLAPDDVACLFLGHNFRLKGLPDLLRALRLRLDRDPDARPIRLVVCGGGRLAPIRRLARRTGLDDHVRLIGFLPDIRPAFVGSDLFCLPTYYDPCSLVVFEALASGLPVITTSYNGAGDVMTSGREGYVISSPSDHAALADALDRLADDGTRHSMARRAAELGRAQSFENHLARLIDVFEEVAQAKRPSTKEGPTCRPSSSQAARAHGSAPSLTSSPSR